MTSGPPHRFDQESPLAAMGADNNDAVDDGERPMTPAVGDDESELLGEVADPYPNCKSVSAEKVMVYTRRSRPVAGVAQLGTDDPEMNISTLQAQHLQKCSMVLRWTCINFSQSHSREEYYSGQAGLVKTPNTDDIVFVTCKHNFATSHNKNGQLEFCNTPHHLLSHNDTPAYFKIPGTGWEKTTTHAVVLRDRAEWSSGIDLAMGPVVNPSTTPDEMFPDYDAVVNRRLLRFFLEQAAHFTAVEDTFVYEQNQKVGLVVRGQEKTDRKSAFDENGLASIQVSDPGSYRQAVLGDAGKIGLVLGDPDGVMIYTGQISHVGEHHLEHNVNTYKGCSGAIMIGLDPDRPSSYLKALAVHAGHSAQLEQNIAFKLAGMWNNPAADGRSLLS